MAAIEDRQTAFLECDCACLGSFLAVSVIFYFDLKPPLQRINFPIMATIHPPDKSFRMLAYSTLPSTLLYLRPHYIPREFLPQIAVTIVWPTLTFFVLAHRYITLERACALRLTLTPSQFKSFMRFRPVIQPGEVSAYLWLTIICSLLVNEHYFNTLDEGAAQQGTDAVGAVVRKVAWLVIFAFPLYIWYKVVAETTSVEVDGEEMVLNKDVPLRVLLGRKEVQEKVGKGWVRVARCSSKQEVWLQSAGVAVQQQAFDLKTTFTPAHHLYKPQLDGLPSGNVLRITLT